MKVRRLSEDEFHATMLGGMEPIDEQTPVRQDFWAYVGLIPVGDHGGFDFSRANIEAARRSADLCHDHVLLGSSSADVYMVVVIDRKAGVVLGHRLLDLPRLYGLRDQV